MKKQTPWVWTPEASDQIEQARARGLSNRAIAKMAGCSHQNIDQVFKRIEAARTPPLTVKITDEQRAEDKSRLRILVLAEMAEDEPHAQARAAQGKEGV